MEDKYDIRDDEEQEKKGKEVMELLVAAGYFRARIKVRKNCLLQMFTQFFVNFQNILR